MPSDASFYRTTHLARALCEFGHGLPAAQDTVKDDAVDVVHDAGFSMRLRRMTHSTGLVIATYGHKLSPKHPKRLGAKQRYNVHSFIKQLSQLPPTETGELCYDDGLSLVGQNALLPSNVTISHAEKFMIVTKSHKLH